MEPRSPLKSEFAALLTEAGFDLEGVRRVPALPSIIVGAARWTPRPVPGRDRAPNDHGTPRSAPPGRQSAAAGLDSPPDPFFAGDSDLAPSFAPSFASSFAPSLGPSPAAAFSSEPLSAASFPPSFLPPLSRKSVTYQPVPLRWKAAAEMSLVTGAFSSHWHSVSFGSLNFWMVSNTLPHCWHSYS